MNKTAIALGTFDGVHIGHQAVIKAAVDSGFKSLAVAFKFPPKAYFDDSIGCITTFSDKDGSLRDLGLKEIYYLDFNEVRDMSPTDFLYFLKNEYNCAFISCGFNYRFGKNGAGDIELLREFCEKNGIILKVSEPIAIGNTTVSSTYIRSLLSDGRVAAANELLARLFGFSATVIHGDGRGHIMGFPTANQLYPKELAPVKHGVYKTIITVNGKTYNGITNIGHRPTYETGDVRAETFILDFYDDIYGMVADVRLVKFIRPEQKFDSLEELKTAIKNDLSE